MNGELQQAHAAVGRWPTRAARIVSLTAAALVTLLLIEYPQLVATGKGVAPRGVLWLTMLGACLGWVHGFGIRSRRPWLAHLTGPWAAWPLMGTLLLLLPIWGR